MRDARKPPSKRCLVSRARPNCSIRVTLCELWGNGLIRQHRSGRIMWDNREHDWGRAYLSSSIDITTLTMSVVGLHDFLRELKAPTLIQVDLDSRARPWSGKTRDDVQKSTKEATDSRICYVFDSTTTIRCDDTKNKRPWVDELVYSDRNLRNSADCEREIIMDIVKSTIFLLFDAPPRGCKTSFRDHWVANEAPLCNFLARNSATKTILASPE